MIQYLLSNLRLTALFTIALLCASCARKEAEPTPPEPVRPVQAPRPEPQFKPAKATGEAVQEAGLVNQNLPQLRSHLEIRTVVVRAGEPVSLPVENEGVLELRVGSLATVIDGQRQQHQRGEMWQVAKGSRVTLQAFGEMAVLRAIYLVPGEK